MFSSVPMIAAPDLLSAFESPKTSCCYVEAFIWWARVTFKGEASLSAWPLNLHVSPNWKVKKWQREEVWYWCRDPILLRHCQQYYGQANVFFLLPIVADVAHTWSVTWFISQRLLRLIVMTMCFLPWFVHLAWQCCHGVSTFQTLVQNSIEPPAPSLTWYAQNWLRGTWEQEEAVIEGAMEGNKHKKFNNSPCAKEIWKMSTIFLYEKDSVLGEHK